MWNRMHGWLIVIALRVNRGVHGSPFAVCSLPLGGLLLTVRKNGNALSSGKSHMSHESHKPHPIAESLIIYYPSPRNRKPPTVSGKP
jgi:hypothetical protein